MKTRIRPKDAQYIFPVYRLGNGAKAVYLRPIEKNPIFNPLHNSTDFSDKVCYDMVLPSDINGRLKRSYRVLEDIPQDDERLYG